MVKIHIVLSDLSFHMDFTEISNSQDFKSFNATLQILVNTSQYLL